MLCCLKFHVKQRLIGENQYNNKLFPSCLKTVGLKNKNVININYFIIELIKMKLLIFLDFNPMGLTDKYELIPQISIYNWLLNCTFRYLA